MTLILSHQVLDEILAKAQASSPTTWRASTSLFGGRRLPWYHTMRHLCPRTEGGDRLARRGGDAGRALQDHENRAAARTKVKPQPLKQEHQAAIGRLLGVPG